MSDFVSDNYNRNNTSDNEIEQSTDNVDRLEKIKMEVNNLFEKGVSDITYADIESIREKYVGDDKLIDEIHEVFSEQKKKILRRAKKFVQKVLKKYGHLPTHKLLRKAHKYKVKKQMSDGEFEIFRREIQKEVVGFSQRGPSPVTFERTRISKTLGEIAAPSETKLVVKEDEFIILDKILRLHADTKILHSQVMIQSLTYRDCAPEALIGKLYEDGNMIENPANHVHPIIAALFLPKINILDNHMLFANLAGIIKSKHTGKPINVLPDYELYYDLVTDPNDAVCDIEKPLDDLYKRCLLQKDIWDAVLNLRNGRYYKTNLTSFLNSVDNCRVNVYDTPDLVYIQDEGAILRRILSAFSFRPTIVSTMPISYLVVESNPYARPPTLSNVTAIPMITLRLPLHTRGPNVPVNLDQALHQSHYYLNKYGNIVPKHQAIIYSKGVLIFYVNRRYQAINIHSVVSTAHFTRLPKTVAGFERLNTKPVNFGTKLDIMNEPFNLRSVVLVEVADQRITNDLIVGSTCMIMKHFDLQRGITQDNFWLYDPHGAAFVGNRRQRNDPITWLHRDGRVGSTADKDSFMGRARTRGTIFVYQKIGSSGQHPFYTDEPC